MTSDNFEKLRMKQKSKQVKTMAADPERTFKKKVITIHGVNPDRNWQVVARRVLEPHFEVISLGYRGYDGLQGPVRLICHPLVFVVALVMAAASIWLPISLWTPVALFAGGVAIARLQRFSHVRRIKKKISEQGHQPRPHLIAHSFGTYVSGRSLRFYDIRYGRVVLAGSILPRSFKWKTYLEKRAVFEVRNEVTHSDIAVRIASIFRYLAWDIGSAGLTGFVGPWAHDVAEPWSSCEHCVREGLPGRLHNIFLGERYGHSGVFLGPTHQRRFWLPYLWGFCVSSFGDFEDRCWDIANRLYDDDVHRATVLLQDIASSTWPWTGGLTLREYIVGLLAADQANGLIRVDLDMGTIADEVLRRMSLVIALAAQEGADSDADSNVRRGLYPLVAIQRAKNDVVEQFGS